MSFNFKVQIVFLALISLYACKKHVGLTPNAILRDPGQNAEKQKKTEPIKLSSLTTTIKEIKEFTVGEHIGISLELFPTKYADYYHFYICSTEENKCNPVKTDPKKFYLTTHQFNNPPRGNIEVFVASCVAPKKVKNPEKNCGPLTKSAFFMNPSKDTKTKDLLEEREEIIEENRENCHDFFNNIESYYNKMIASYNFSQDALVQAVQKQLDMGKELSCELIYSNVYQDLITDETTKSEGNSGSKKSRVWTPASITLVSLGSISAAAGVAYMAKGAYETNFAKAFARSLTLTQTENDEYAAALNNSKKLEDKLENELNKSYQKLNLANSKDRDKHNLILGLRDLYHQHTEAIEQGRAKLKANRLKIEKSIK